ncbi:MAG: zf-HC2 domain-containing protein [Ilumatobacteraceae bacterium]
MSDCNETLKELDRFLDGELTELTKTAVEHHLHGCMDCLSAFDFHAELRIVIREKATGDELPDGLRDRVLQCFGDFAGIDDLDDVDDGAVSEDSAG